MFGNYNYNPYQSPNPSFYQNPYQARLDSLQQPQTQSLQITRVNGRNGAQAYQMPPNSSTLLLDETAPVVWLAQTDGAGYKTCTPYNITPYQAQPEPDYNSLNERISKLEAILNGKSDVAAAGAASAGTTGGNASAKQSHADDTAV